MTILNRLSRLFGGNAAEQDALAQVPGPCTCEKVMMNDTMRAQLLLTCEQIRHHLAQGASRPYGWRGLSSPAIAPALIPVLIGRSAKAEQRGVCAV